MYVHIFSQHQFVSLEYPHKANRKIRDMADQYPSAEVTGTDLSPVQPDFVPPNCKFEIDDASALWTFTPNSFDLVFLRFMLGSFSDWTEVYREAFK
jgi:ubiquinone/menaquinone biosynthesis C-methylase UbiE